MKAKSFERGQAMVLIILAIVGIFGFAALAVDMGQMFAARRAAQNAADAAALGAAYDAVAGSLDPFTAINVGYDLALANGYNDDLQTNWVFVNNPPIGGPYCDICNDVAAYEYYQVKIQVRLRPIFAQLIYPGAQEVTVEAIAHAKTFDSATTGDAILSLNRESQDSMLFNGTTKVRVDGGNIRSSGGMTKTGASGGIFVTNGGKIYYGMEDGIFGHTETLHPGPSEDSPYVITGMNDPTCPTATEAAGWETVNGVKHAVFDEVDYYYYPSGLSVKNLPKGIHCVRGGIGKGDYVGKGVLIVLLTGGIKQTGNDSFYFTAATDMKDRNGTQWGGMVLYVPSSNTSELNFGGNSDAYFQGVVYAPGAFCDIGGNPDGKGYHTAFICDMIRYHGTPDVNILYNAEELFHFPPMVELVQ
jgi:uncharacterized Zn-binding protein involved in type VI secretion